MRNLKAIKSLMFLGFALAVAAAPGLAAEKAAVKKTCCQEAATAGKECRDKCCLAAHRDGKSCEKCNPGKEDLRLKKSKAR